MKLNKLIMFISIILILFISFSSVSAQDNLNNTIIDDNTLTENINENLISNDISSDNYQSNDDNTLGISSDNEDIMADSSSTSNTITIVADKTNPNQVLKPTVQPKIDEASPGDTIILKGNFVHCHFTISKPINIIAYPGASLDPCPHHTHENVEQHGVFLITEGGSGTVIEGFRFHNDDRAETPFSFLIRGASNVIINNCSMNVVNSNIDPYSGIIIENANNITLSNFFVNNTVNGIKIINSTNINIINFTISHGQNNAISVDENSKFVSIINSTLSNNAKSAISLLNADNVYVINNFIENNGNLDYDSGSGIYVNSNITKLVVKGNIFLSNNLHAILYDYRARNLNNEEGADTLTIVDNNYFAGHKSMVLHHRIYKESDSGNLNYDSDNDIYVDVGAGNGAYIEGKSYVYMQKAFVCEGEVVCGFTYYTTALPWTLSAPGNNGKYDFSLYLSNITQIKKGVYQIAIVDNKGNVASDFNSFNVTFYLNNFTTVDNNENELYKTVKIENGIATIDFTDLKDKYLETGNVITASFPGVASYVVSNPYVQFNVEDKQIPGVLDNTKINAGDITVTYGVNEYITAGLTDEYGNALAEKDISVQINGKTIKGVSDEKGIVKIPVTISAGTYSAVIAFNGDEEYNVSSATVKVVISKQTPKITPSTLTTYPVSDEYFKAKLTDANGKVLASQKVTFKINGKTYSAKTDKNGIAKVKVSLTSKKTYTVTVKYGGSTNYKAISKTGKIVVKTGSKKSKITASNIKVKKNTKKSFSFKLLTSAGKAISKQKVTVKVNGKTYTVKTNAKGVAKISVKFSAVKKYKVSIKFLGNKNFKAASKTSTITVTK